MQQPPFHLLHHHLLHHHHHHIPLVLLCPCSCHRRHHRCHLLPRFASSNPHLPPPCNLILPHIPCSGSSQNHKMFGLCSIKMTKGIKMNFYSVVRAQEQDWNENQVPEEEEEDVFVLTDEWMEFFAKSEAKRKLAKQQKKKARK
ncbi:hypothetical protein MUK42_34525 [Musa troglodytarum]|uniref:Uncharacterized protein n=1 Tax=Musa troglodytarum TaxID=320322 RepID=A0A9E7HX50_9LILI|nr:hypothetical protein MUK42_34525 [Musa troglodytarum]